MLCLFALCVVLTGTLTGCNKNKKEISQKEFQQMLDDAEKKGAAEARKEMQQESEAKREDVKVQSEKEVAAKNNVGVESLYLTGTIGGADDAVFNYNSHMDDGTVTFTVSGVVNKRTIKQGSFNPETGRLVIQEYTTGGQYIGDFVGTWRNGVYSGVFTNKKTGGKVDFKLR